MSGEQAEARVLFSVVLGDANVLYSRVLRDYVLYAMAHQLIRVRWSRQILDEAIEHLVENVESFDEAAGERLVVAMNGTFPYSQVEMTDDATAAVADFTLIDEGDRHRTAVSRLPGATDESTIAALRGAKAERTAELMEALLRNV